MSDVPTWLQLPNPIAYYHPEHLLFIPQRLITQRNGYPSLLDYTDRPYYSTTAKSHNLSISMAWPCSSQTMAIPSAFI